MRKCMLFIHLRGMRKRGLLHINILGHSVTNGLHTTGLK